MRKHKIEYSILDKVNYPNDIRKLNIDEKKQLCDELRDFIIKNVSKTGGHLASSLGDVELTVAIHDVFNTPQDKVIWDVGHQTYAHKIITGRKDKFSTLRQLNGISGFPKIDESEYDNFDTGHSSTSVSAALGMARARDINLENIKKKNMPVKDKIKLINDNNYHVIAVIGDGALTGGMAIEAINDAGASDTNLIVILNDNEMSISKNSGGLARTLTQMRTRKFYRNSSKIFKETMSKIPKFGNWVLKIVHRVKYAIKSFFLPNYMFEDIGFTYLGPIDGNDLEKVEALLKNAKDFDGPVFIHCKTIKGKGYKPAEENPDKFHSTGPFNIETGESLKPKSADYSKVFGDKLVKKAKTNPKIVAITAAMKDGTGLHDFALKYPDRFFDVEIAEQHAMTLAAGLAINGCIPVVALYSSFLQRAYDQLVHDVCMQNLHVVIGVDRSGIVGADGETHQGLLDLAFLNTIPNMTIMAPKDFKELEKMLDFAIDEMKTPVAIRYPRGSESKVVFGNCKSIELGKAEIFDNNMYKKDDVTNIYLPGDIDDDYKGEQLEIQSQKINEDYVIKIIGIGKMVTRAFEVAQMLFKRNGIESTVINARFLKPFDEDIVIDYNDKEEFNKQFIFSIEDGTLNGGLYSTIVQTINDHDLKDTKVMGFGYKDKFVKQGSVEEIEKIYGLDTESIYREIIKRIKNKQ